MPLTRNATLLMRHTRLWRKLMLDEMALLRWPEVARTPEVEHPD
jgi:hypothetical protein